MFETKTRRVIAAVAGLWALYALSWGFSFYQQTTANYWFSLPYFLDSLTGMHGAYGLSEELSIRYRRDFLFWALSPSLIAYAWLWVTISKKKDDGS